MTQSWVKGQEWKRGKCGFGRIWIMLNYLVSIIYTLHKSVRLAGHEFSFQYIPSLMLEIRRDPIQYILTLPPRMVERFESLENRCRPDWFATCDPHQTRLGSGGGTLFALLEAWRQSGSNINFWSWLQHSRKMVIHSGGQSRSLPSYSTVGKLLMPIPVFRWARGQRLDQTLLDVQLPDYERVLQHAPSKSSVMVASGDVLLRFSRNLPQFPEVDVLGLGMWVTPEVASHFGVFFCPRKKPSELAFFLQKPSIDKIRELSPEYLFLVDTGLWILSDRAIRALMQCCGFNGEEQDLVHWTPQPYEMYSQFGLGLGCIPSFRVNSLENLTSAVVPIPQAEFYHFGASRQMIESMSRLQNLELDEIKLGMTGAKRYPDLQLQNARFNYPLKIGENHTLWIENSTIPSTWQLAFNHVITGVPENSWDLRLEPGVCLDWVPIGEEAFCIRCYGMDDKFSGDIGDQKTQWLRHAATSWFENRGISLAEAGFSGHEDIQTCPLFPVLNGADIDPRFIEWLFTDEPKYQSDYSLKWLSARRLSAQQMIEQVNLARYYQQRQANRNACLQPMLRNFQWNVFYKLDLDSTAKNFALISEELPNPIEEGDASIEPLQIVHERMFRSAVARHRGDKQWKVFEQQAFSCLQNLIVRDAQLTPVVPRCAVQDDQIVWGRSPIRLDLAGGWSDTPPYCLENGGKVVNVAVDINGQPPIQIFAKLCERPEIVLRSIDLGVERHIHTYEELDTYSQPGNEFALAKAGFALAGFLPRFHSNGGYASLKEQLEEFGGGIEVSMLSAVPKGSGLGTSSILAATLLATLGDLCGLDWDRNVLFTRTLALEQMLTTGGGWQDQAGGIYRGIKLIETQPGLSQKPTLRWMPDHLFEEEYANKTILLYYTGITRMAMNILHEIVRGIFLNSPNHLRIIQDIALNADIAFNAIQCNDYSGMTASIKNTWELKQRLDSGTNPPQVQTILDRIHGVYDAVTLLGAGGGGYLLILAKDAEAGMRIRRILTENPPNPRARFVNLSLSYTGLQLTRS